MRRPAVLRANPWWALRRRLRTPAAHWALAVGLGLATVVVVGDQLERARAEADRYGRWRPAVVATRDLAAGVTLGPDDVRTVRLPASMVPAGAVTGPPLGRRLASPLRAREVLVADRLRGGSSALAAAVPEDWRAVAVAVAEPALEVGPGDVVDLLAPDAASGTHGVVVADARVAARTEGMVTVLVPTTGLAPLADAVAAGSVIVALSGR